MRISDWSSDVCSSDLEQDLRGAWERGELSLVYQPVYRMSDNRLAGAEALLRWQHPEHGPTAPSVFIDVAEQSGLIEIIGPAVLQIGMAAGRERVGKYVEVPVVAGTIQKQRIQK